MPYPVRYCRGCQSNKGMFSGEVCRRCERQRHKPPSEDARKYVANWLKLRVPAVVLKQMQGER